MAVATEAQLQNIQQAFQRFVFREAVLPERPRIRAGKCALHKVDMLFRGHRQQLQPDLIAQHAHDLSRKDVLLLAAFKQ